MASLYRRKNGIAPPQRWQHPALTSDSPLLRAAAERARQLGEANGWSPSTTRCAMDSLTALLDGRPDGERVTITEIRARSPRHASAPRVAEVLGGLSMLQDDTILAVRSWIGRRTGDLPPGFATAVRDWLLVLLDGDARSRPKSATTIYVYSTAVQPLISRWSADRSNLREVTAEDIRAGLGKLRGHHLHTTISAVRSLFRFARKRRLIFTNPAQRLKAGVPEPSLLPMTEDEIRAVEQAITHPGSGWSSPWPLSTPDDGKPSALSLWTTWTCPTGASPSPATPSGLATSATRRCRPGSATAAPPGRTPNRHVLMSGGPHSGTGLSPGATSTST